MIIAVLIGLFIFTVVGLILTAIGLFFVGRWKMFTKAGIEGVYSIIPFYSTYCIICKIAKLHIGYFIVHLSSILLYVGHFVVSFIYFLIKQSTLYSFSVIEWIATVLVYIVSFSVYYNLGRKFKKGNLWSILSVFISFVTLPLLGLFSKNVYHDDVEVSKGGLFFSK